MATGTVFDNLLEKTSGEKRFMLLIDKKLLSTVLIEHLMSFDVNFANFTDFGLSKYNRCDGRSSRYDKTVIVWFFEK